MKVPYPDNWSQISAETIQRRGRHCERCGKGYGEVPWLTTHHIDGNPQNNVDDNLYVCCPKCHFFIDRYIYPRRPFPLQGIQLPLEIVENSPKIVENSPEIVENFSTPR